MPTLGMTASGEVYEENSVRNDGFGIGNFARYADQGNLLLGEQDHASIQMRKRAAHVSKLQRMAVQKHNKRQASRDKLEARNEEHAKEVMHATQQMRAQAHTRRAGNMYMKARRQKRNSEDYSSLMGDPTEGFGSEGTLVRDKNLRGELSKVDRIQARNSFQGSYDSHERFGAAQAVAPVGAQKVVVRVGASSHPLLAYSHPASFYGSSAMGWGFNPFKAIGKVARGIGKVAKGIGKVAVKGVQISAKVAGHIVSDPIKLTDKALRKIPVVSQVYKGVDKLTGGAISSAVSLATLPGDALKGDKITKERLVDNLTFALRVGAVVASGGSAAAIIGASSGQLKKGPLGKTALGRALLTVGEVAGLAVAGTQIATNAASAGSGATTAVGEKVVEKTTTEVVQQALLTKGQQVAQDRAVEAVASKAGPLGALIATTALNNPSALSPEALSKVNVADVAQGAIDKGVAKASNVTQDQVLSYAEQKGKEEAAKKFEQKTGIPIGTAAYVTDVVTGEKTPMIRPIDITKEVSELELKAKKFSPSDVQATISNNAEALSVDIAKVPDMKLTVPERNAIAAQVDVIETQKIKAATDDAIKKAAETSAKEKALAELTAKTKALRTKFATEDFNDKPALAAEINKNETKMVELYKEVKVGQDETAKKAVALELTKSQGAMKVAAASEGRYWPGYETAHPMLQYGLVPRAVPKVKAS